jgi:hypothetical protein
MRRRPGDWREIVRGAEAERKGGPLRPPARKWECHDNDWTTVFWHNVFMPDEHPFTFCAKIDTRGISVSQKGVFDLEE